MGTLLTALHRSLAARREALKKGDEGFTLIELLVVILIIGILTAIAVPVFLSQQDQARDAAAKSDLGVAKVALVSYFTANPGGSTPDAADLADFGYVQSDGIDEVSVEAGSTSTTFCIQTRVSDTDRWFHITGTESAATGQCAGGGGGDGEDG